MMRAYLMSGAAFAPADARSGSAGAGNVDLPIAAEAAAAEVGLSLPAFWRAVGSGRLPRPVYPAPRAPRWFRSELRAALEATRALPAEAKAARRAARLTRNMKPAA